MNFDIPKDIASYLLELDEFILEWLESLRRTLVSRLRENEIALDCPGLAEYLRESVVNQVAIDQPGYSGFKTALANAR